MNPFIYVLAGIIAGSAVTGVTFLIPNFRRIRAKRADSASAAQTIPDGAAEVLDLLASAGMVLDSQNVVLRATQGAAAYGLVNNRTLVHKVLAELADQARESGEITQLETEIVTGLRANKVFIHARAARLSTGYVLLLVEDRTESKRLEETRRDFVANISHELKTPIGAISLLSEALQEGIDDPQLVEKFARNLQREANRLASLVQDIIELSRLQSAETSSKAELLDLSNVVADAVERNAFLASTKKVHIRVSAPEGIKVFGDREMLTAGLKNLIENAIIYSDEGSQVGVGLRNLNGIAEISVADNGVGIPAEEQDRIFERFYRVDASRSRQTGGTGLGLSIVKHVAQKHRGEVKLFSQVGLGSTFTLRLPVADDSLSQPAERK